MMLGNLPFPAFEPDRSPFVAAAGDNIVNVLPVRDGWGPFPSLVTYTEALPAPCRGAVYVRTTAGAYKIIAGTATGLYQLDTAGNEWTDITGSSGPYSLADGHEWSFCQFGNLLIAAHLGDPVQSFDVDTGTEAEDLAGSPPQARYVWAAGDFLVLGHLQAMPNQIQWSGINDATYWTVGQRGSDFQVFPDGNEVMGGLTDPGGAIVFQRDGIKAMRFAPDSGYTFTFAPLNSKRGVIAPYSIVGIGAGDFFYISDNGFYRGAQGVPVGAERVDRWFFSTVAYPDVLNTVGTVDPLNKTVWWKTSQIGETRLFLGYNWQLDRWCYSTSQITAIAALTTTAISWDDLADLYATIDDIDVPFDSPLFQGGRPVFGAFDEENRMGFFAGDSQEATLETAQIEFASGLRTFVNAARVETDATTFTLAVGKADYHGETLTYTDAASPSSRTRLVPLRASARLHTFRMVIPAGEVWGHVTGIRPEGRVEGKQ